MQMALRSLGSTIKSAAVRTLALPAEMARHLSMGNYTRSKAIVFECPIGLAYRPHIRHRFFDVHTGCDRTAAGAGTSAHGETLRYRKDSGSGLTRYNGYCCVGNLA